MKCNKSVAPDHPNLAVTKSGRVGKSRTTYMVTGVASSGNYRVYHNSLDALERAIKERVFYVKTPQGFDQPFRPSFTVFANTLKDFTEEFKRHRIFAAPMKLEDFPLTYQGRKRTIYLDAARVNLEDGFRDSYSEVRAFVKVEKYLFERKEPVPRIIQPRDSKYLVQTGRYMKPIEKNIYNIINKMFKDTTVYKGLNADVRGQSIAQTWARYADPVAIGVDASRFDQHVSNAALKWEHSIYQLFYPGDKFFSRLMGLQRSNRCVGTCPEGRVKYKTPHNRMSGDSNTSSGNVVIMCGAMYSFLRNYKFETSLVNDGDDCVIIVERKFHQQIIEDLPIFFRDIGFTMVVEDPVDVLEKIVFCQSQPVMTAEGTYRMVRQPKASLAKDAISIKPLSTEKVFRRYMSAVGAGGLALTSGIPVLQNYYECFLRNSNGATPLTDPSMDGGFWRLSQGMEKKHVSITPESRLSFWRAFDVSPAEQVACEEYYQGLELSVGDESLRFVPLPGFAVAGG